MDIVGDKSRETARVRNQQGHVAKKARKNIAIIFPSMSYNKSR